MTPAGEGLRDDDAIRDLGLYAQSLRDADAARLDQTFREAEALTLDELADMIRQAGGQLDEHAHDCRGDESEWAYRFEAACVHRAARILDALARKEGGAL